MIVEFQKETRWLSNFAPVRIVLDGLVFSSVEHAYMSAKSDDKDWKDFCADRNNKAGQIKRKSKGIKLVENWETKKVTVMAECVKQKFNQEPYREKLIDTGNEHIQEGNMWGDKFWGVCLRTNKGDNRLGKLIMSVRSELIKS